MASGKKVFKLNAHQGNDEETARDSSMSLSEAVKDPSSGDFPAKNSNKPSSQTNMYSKGTNDTKEQPITTSNPQVPRQEEEGGITEDLRRLTLLEAQEERKLPLRFLSMVGLFVIALLVGLIVAVAVSLSGGDEDSALAPLGTRAPSTQAPTPAPTPLVTLAPQVLLPTQEPATTLGRVAQRGVLRCGIPEQPGFAEINFQTGLYEGFDVDMVSADFAFVLVTLFSSLTHIVFFSSNFSAVLSRPLFSERTTRWNMSC
jgi:hypothetical protein